MKKEIYVGDDKILLQLNMEDCLRITGSLMLLSKLDDTDDRLNNLSDRVIYWMIQKIKEERSEE